jgi:hypothetical protein
MVFPHFTESYDEIFKGIVSRLWFQNLATLFLQKSRTKFFSKKHLLNTAILFFFIPTVCVDALN